MEAIDGPSGGFDGVGIARDLDRTLARCDIDTEGFSDHFQIPLSDSQHRDALGALRDTNG